ncbi:SNU71 (YGR013W) [Zygosaccharomyces parabailii]|uniref:U1 small nuclear ribonucleoprotein component SNU71 n=1 Tax=Zygosaccharomyces bailii (strain CLIB 213 / ATCC 58445 / CBS 680 / BCRC 21525 / NBRC 1098 / NCYC 1416 / NRRL Y-2227) TaxID=1333698 RepID=A0A8J2T2N0_ZYGB2|nr:SNU71 (YGR013W) [Zygosaccharomyces parabailii]CDF87490.1 BN860_07558g1_1 [Zygosaccharomyces bailii CLIB 213]
MNEIIYVSPQLYLVSDERWRSELEKPGYVPILRADIHKFQESLKSVLTARDLSSARHTSNLNALGQKDEHSAAESSDADNKIIQSAGGAAKYQSLKQFLPISLVQQLHTVSLMGFPTNISLHNLECFLCDCLGLVLERIHAAQDPDMLECWTNIQSLETQDIFIRIAERHKCFANFVQIMGDWFQSEEGPSVEIHIEANTAQFIKDQDVCNIELDKDLMRSLNQLWQQLNHSAPDKSLAPDNNVEYRIDLNTLSDLPQESLGQLCQDIMGFRTKVVTIEREKRVREAYEESKRRKQQMMKIFDQIRKSRRETGDHRPDEDDDEEEEEEEEEDDDDDDGEEDSVLEQHRVDQERRESENRYRTILKHLQTKIEPRLASLQERIYRASHYDQIRSDEQALYLKELLHQAVDPYYDHHRSYKLQEETADNIDRQEHPSYEAQPLEGAKLPTIGSEVQEHAQQKEKQQDLERSDVSYDDSQDQEQFKIKFAFKRAIDSSATHISSEDEDHDTAHAVAPEVLKEQDLDAKLKRLNESGLVQELVKEYLGVYEQDLVDYIYETIREKRSKHALLTELRETFDDDAVNIVEKIWSSEELNAT